MQPSRRPDDGRFGQNPNRLFKHHQFQVILKPSPDEVQQIYLDSLEAVRHRSAAARHALRGRQLGVADARRLGHRLAGDARRARDHAVHLLPAGGRREPRADVASRSPTVSSGSRCSCRRSTTCSTSSGRRGVKYGEVRLREEIEQSKYAFDQDTGISAEDFAAFHRVAVRRQLRVCRAAAPTRSCCCRRSNTA